MTRLSTQSVVKGTLIVVSANFLRAVLRLLQFTVIAFKFGASYVTDAYLVAQTVPFVLRGVTQGAMGLAAVPVLIDLRTKRSENDAWLLANSLFTLTSAIMVVLVLVVVITASVLTSGLAPGFSEPTRSLTVTLIRLMAPIILFVGLSTIPLVLLLSYQHYITQAITSLFLSLGVISFALLWADRIGIMAVPLGAVAGIAGEFIVVTVFLARRKRRMRFSWNFSVPGLRQVIRLTVPRMMILVLMRLNLIVDRVFASALGAGYISALTYADRIIQIPAMILTTALGEVLLPKLSQHASEGEIDRFSRRFWRSLSVVGFFILPLAILLVLLREPIIRVFFQRGAFDSTATQLTGVAVLFYGVGMLSMSFNLLVRVFFWPCRMQKRL